MRFSSSSTALAAATALLASIPSASAFWRMPCSGPIVTERADPVVSPGEVSGHVHTVYGGSAFNFTMDYAEARAAECTSCRVTADRSNYWVPELFYQDPTNKTFTPVQNSGALIYYLQRGANDSDTILPFPEDFRMVSGTPSLRSFDADSMDQTSQEYLAQKAITFTCLGTSNPSTHMIPDYNCPDGLRAEVFFPSCWDGVNKDSTDHKSHVAFPSNEDSGSCPDSHPHRLVSIFYEVIWSIDPFSDMWVDGKHPFVFSMGDPTGYGYHGDFVNGWDVTVLDNAIKTCTSDSGVVEDCGAFEFVDEDVMNGCYVPSMVDEPITGWLEQLPGCNPVTTTESTTESTCNNTAVIGQPATQSTDVSALGWSYVACALDNVSDRILSGSNQSNDTMTVESCIEYCGDNSYTYAGLEYSTQCYCGNSIDSSTYANLYKCQMPCGGNSTEFCGDAAKMSVYKKGT